MIEGSFTVWIMVENDDTGDRTYWSVDHFHSADEAIREAEDMAEQQYARTGVEPQRMED